MCMKYVCIIYTANILHWNDWHHQKLYRFLLIARITPSRSWYKALRIHVAALCITGFMQSSFNHDWQIFMVELKHWIYLSSQATDFFNPVLRFHRLFSGLLSVIPDLLMAILLLWWSLSSMGFAQCTSFRARISEFTQPNNCCLQANFSIRYSPALKLWMSRILHGNAAFTGMYTLYGVHSHVDNPPLLSIRSAVLKMCWESIWLISQPRLSVCWRHSARRLSTASEWSLTWNGEGTETHSWCCTVPLFVPS